MTGHRHLPAALIVLTFTTGLVDAVTYLGLGRVFAANMTGNVVLLGFALAQAGGLPVVAPLVSLAAFLAGALTGGRLAVNLLEQHRRHVSVAFAAEAALVAAAAVVAAAVSTRPSSTGAYAVIALLALGMGLRNATVRKLAVPDLTTTVLTLTLTGLAADSRAAGGTGKGSHRRIAAVAAMLAGAFVGALLEKHGLVLPLLLTAALVAATLAAYLVLNRAATGADTAPAR